MAGVYVAVVGLRSWAIDGVEVASSPADAVERALARAAGGSGHRDIPGA